MYPILFNVWKISIYSHGVMVALGMVLGGWLVFHLASRNNLSTTKLFDLLLYVVVVGLVGARINYILFYMGDFHNFWDYLKVWNGGMISYGGLIFGFAAAIIFLRKNKQNVWQWLDVGIIALMLGWAIGRIGCFLAGDFIGRPTDSSLGIIFPILGEIPRHPVALYESLASLLIFGILFFIYQARSFRDGLLFFIGLGLYSLARFIIEFFRIYENNLWSLSYSQIFLLLLFIFSVAGFFYLRGNREYVN